MNKDRIDDRDILLYSLKEMSRINKIIDKKENTLRNASLDSFSLSARQAEVLKLIYDLSAPPSLTRLAHLSATSHQNLKIILNNLEEKSLVVLFQDNLDKRKLRIRLTLKGKRIASNLSGHAQKVSEKIMEEFTTNEIANFAFLIRKLSDVLEKNN